MSELAQVADVQPAKSGRPPRWLELDADDRAAIIAARRAGRSVEAIATWLTDNGWPISQNSIRNFLLSVGEYHR